MFHRLLRVAVPAPGRMLRHEHDSRARGLLRASLPLLPAGLVLLALSALVVQSVALQRAMSALRAEISGIYDPARMAVRDIQFSLVREVAGARGYLLTGDTSYVRRNAEARRQRRAAVEEVGRIAAGAGAPDVVRRVAGSVAMQFRRADPLLDSLFSGALSRAAFVERLPEQQRRVEDVSSGVRDAGIQLSDLSAARVAALERLQRRAMLTTVALSILAGLAVLIVANLGLSYRALARREAWARAESERARAEAEERRAEGERVASSRARLVRGFTHDVKNPLGAAAGCLQLADEGLLPVQDGVRRARRSVDTALRLTDDLLELARIESEGVSVRCAPVRLTALADEVIDEWRAIAEAKGLAVAADPPSADLVVRTDGEKVRQIVGNLVSNAIHYTKAGSIRVRVSAEDGRAADGTAADSAGSVCVEVRDTGPGIAPEQCALLFQEFSRLDTSAGTKGHGLGLAISSRLATALGGRITVESSLGEGSTFCLHLPRDPQDSPVVSRS